MPTRSTAGKKDRRSEAIARLECSLLGSVMHAIIAAPLCELVSCLCASPFMRAPVGSTSGSRAQELHLPVLLHREPGQPLLRQILGGPQEPRLPAREVNYSRAFAASGFSLDDKIRRLRYPRVHLF